MLADTSASKRAPSVKRCRRGTLDALIAASQAAMSWKSGYWLREVALMRASAGYADEVDQVVSVMADGKYRRQAIERIGKGDRRTPRPFFW